MVSRRMLMIIHDLWDHNAWEHTYEHGLLSS
jgi:hypothetical protein